MDLSYLASSSQPPQLAPVIAHSYQMPDWDLFLHRTPSNIVLEVKPRSTSINDDAGDAYCLAISDTSAKSTEGHLKIQKIVGTASSNLGIQGSAPIPILGLLGCFRLLGGRYLVVITDARVLGRIERHDILLSKAISILPIPPLRHQALSEEEKKLERGYLSKLQETLSSLGFHFAPTFDITLTAQRRSDMAEEDRAKTILQRADKRFFWNETPAKELLDAGLEPFVLCLMDGFLRIEPFTINTIQFDYVIISRRDHRRTGVRFHTRGIDTNGNVANFVETEQLIVSAHGDVSSFVQIRGSIPLFWHQRSGGIKPKPVYIFNPETRNAFRKHLLEIELMYGDSVLVSLIDAKGSEEGVGQMFEIECKLYQSPRSRYVAFDFHEMCRNNRYENIQILIDEIEPDLTSHKYFLRDHGGNVLIRQHGVVRTNCIDCLDRTNVVQSRIARCLLREQLKTLGIMSTSEQLEMHLEFESMLKNTWADNADTMSKRYTGVAALKTDYTRTGKRSTVGLLADAVKSGKRLYQSAFADNDKQEGLQLFLSKFRVESRLLRSWLADQQGLRSFKAEKLTITGEKTGQHLILQLAVSGGLFVEYNIDQDKVKEMNFTALRQVARASSDYLAVSMNFLSLIGPRNYRFSSPEMRERFLLAVGSALAILMANTPLYSREQEETRESGSMQSGTSVGSLIDLNFGDGEDSSVSTGPSSVASKSSAIGDGVRQSGNAPPLPSSPSTSAFSSPLSATSAEIAAIPTVAPMPLGMEKYRFLNANIFLAYFDTSNVPLEAVLDVPSWVQRDRDIYCIMGRGVCGDAMENANVSGSLTRASGWLYRLYGHLGPEYDVVHYMMTDNDASIALFVRHSLRYHIADVKEGYLLERISSQYSGAPLSTAAPSPQSMTSSAPSNMSSTGSPARSGAPPTHVPVERTTVVKKSSGGMFGLKSVTSSLSRFGLDTMKMLTDPNILDNPAPSDELNDSSSNNIAMTTSGQAVVGCVVVFRFDDVKVALVNAGPTSTPWSLAQFDLGSDYDHVLMGGGHKAWLPAPDYWVDLATDEGNRAAIRWRELISLRKIGGVSSSTASASSGPSVTWVNCTLSAESMAVEEVDHSISIRMGNLQASVQGDRALDCYVIVQAPFLQKAHRTSTQRGSFEPHWADILTIKSLVSNTEDVLPRRHVIVEIWESYYGMFARGIVPLRECCMKKAPSNFKSVMTNDGEFRGYLSGTIELTSTPSHS